MGFEQRENQMAMIAEAFYINKLTLPPPEGDMTAFEVGQRVEEYVRAALPLFEPMEHEYNGALCEDTFDALLRAGTFGSVQDMPPDLRGRDVYFKFMSPLHDAIERKEASTFMEASELLRIAMEMDPNAMASYDTGIALRDALEGIGVQPRHLRSERQVQAIMQQNAEQAAAEEAAAVAKEAGAATRSSRRPRSTYRQRKCSKTRSRNVSPKRDPHERPDYTEAEVQALRALYRGEGSPRQQKMALDCLIRIYGTHDMSYRPGDEGATNFAEGRRKRRHHADLAAFRRPNKNRS